MVTQLMTMNAYSYFWTIATWDGKSQSAWAIISRNAIIGFTSILLICLNRLHDYGKAVAIEGQVMMRCITHLFLGLKSLHELGTLHRNITPDSIFINSKLQAKLGRYRFLNVPEDPQ